MAPGALQAGLGKGWRVMKLGDYMDPQGVFAEVNPSDKQELLAMLAGEAARRYPGVQPDLLLDKLIRREKEGSTGIGQGVAVPHATVDGIPKTVCMVARLSAAIDFAAIDDRPVNLVFLLISPPAEIGLHIKLLARIARMLKSGAISAAFSGDYTAEQLRDIILREDERHVE